MAVSPSEDSQPATVALIGSGAVRGAWPPVIRALRESGFDVCTAEGANFAMAWLLHAVRRSSGESIPADLADGLTQHLRELRAMIAKSLAEAVESRSLETRPEFESVMRTLVLRDGEPVHVITTNWDPTVEQHVRKLGGAADLSYLHGSIGAPDGLYLPTEVVDEPYRTEAERRELHSMHRRAAGAIVRATRLVIYGLAVSPLDAELAFILGAGEEFEDLKEIHVVDPRYPGVVERLVALRLPRRVEICGSDPRDLSRNWRYSRDELEREKARASETCVSRDSEESPAA